jgi:lipoyl(octanoyl) transferase
MVDIQDLGLQDFESVWQLQKELLSQRAEDKIADRLILVEHPPVYTTGRAFRPEHLLATPPAPVIPVERGGSVTFHEPGQLVGYAIFKLTAERRDIHQFLRGLEQVLINTLANLGYAGTRDARNTGVWIDDKKVAAIGIAIRRWVTWHGFSINIQNTLALTPFISPCGFDASMVTTLKQLDSKPAEQGRDGNAPSLEIVKAQLVKEIQEWWD